MYRLGFTESLDGDTTGERTIELDIVGFLAILGEGSVLAHSNVWSLNWLCCLPRLLPAPHALLRPDRPNELSTVSAYVTGVNSGNHRTNLRYIASILLNKSKKDLPKHRVRKIEIVRVDKDGNDVKETDETNAHFRQIGAKSLSLFNIANVFGFLVWAVLFALSFYWEDGMSLIASILLSSLSSMAGLVNKCEIETEKRGQTKVPEGDVVVRFPNGSMVVVKCHENVARELFFAPEQMVYYVQQEWICRMISLSGTLMLMGGVIFLASSLKKSQLAWAVSYILINIMYWLAAALPAATHWDISRYKVVEDGIDDGHLSCAPKQGTKSINDTEKGASQAYDLNFTRALWQAMCATNHSVQADPDHWARVSDALPKTKEWVKWFELARAESAKTTLLKHPPKAPLEGYNYVWKASGKSIQLPVWDPKAKYEECLHLVTNSNSASSTADSGTTGIATSRSADHPLDAAGPGADRVQAPRVSTAGSAAGPVSPL